MADRVIQRNDTAARWKEVNPVLAMGEIGIETDGAKGYKIGDGMTRWNDLAYPANPTSVVQKGGTSETAVMSQKAVSESIENINSLLQNSDKYILNNDNANSFIKELYIENVPDGITLRLSHMTADEGAYKNRQFYIVDGDYTIGAIAVNLTGSKFPKKHDKIEFNVATGTLSGAKGYVALDWDRLRETGRIAGTSISYITTKAFTLAKKIYSDIQDKISKSELEQSKKEEEKYAYFSPALLRQSQISKEYKIAHNFPNVDIGTHIHNGIEAYNFAPGETKNNPLYVPFEESPYQDYLPSTMVRQGWYIYNPQDGVYDFSTLGKIINLCIERKQRMVLQIGVIDYLSGNSTYIDIDGVRYYSCIPQDLLEILYNSGAVKPSTRYGVNYLSSDLSNDLLFEKYSAYMNALKNYLKENSYNNISYYDVIGFVECRHNGIYGEGINNIEVEDLFYKNLDSSDKLDRWYTLYLNTFDDKLVLAPGLKFETLLNVTGNYKTILQHHIYNVCNMSNSVGNIGLFRDSWSDLKKDYYEPSEDITLIDENNNVIIFSDWIKEKYSNMFISGEFADVSGVSSPYKTLYHGFKLMSVSSLAIHNYTTTTGSTGGIYGATQYGIDCLSAIGYRIVLSNTYVRKNGDSINLSFYLTNIGFDLCREDWWRIYIEIVRNGIVVNSVNLGGLTTLKKPQIPMELDIYNVGKLYEKTINHVSQVGDEVRLIIKDVYNIQHPMVLSNWGRNDNGSYTLAVCNDDLTYIVKK